MCRIHAAATQLKQDEKGAAAFEYGFTAALLAVVLILAAGLLGGNLSATFGGVASSFSTGAFNTGAFTTGLSGSGQTVPAAGASFCERPLQAFSLAPSSSSCASGVPNPAVTPAATVGYPAAAG